MDIQNLSRKKLGSMTEAKVKEVIGAEAFENHIRCLIRRAVKEELKELEKQKKPKVKKTNDKSKKMEYTTLERGEKAVTK